MDNIVTINARKYDGSLHRSWDADFVESDGDLLTFVGTFENEVVHPDIGIIKAGTTSYEYYWLDRWCNIFRFHEPNGDFRNFYCNVNMPPTFKNGCLDYVDLDIDILVDSDLNYRILDQEEYEQNSTKFCYSKNTADQVTDALATIEKMIKTKNFPFDRLT